MIAPETSPKPQISASSSSPAAAAAAAAAAATQTTQFRTSGQQQEYSCLLCSDLWTFQDPSVNKSSSSEEDVAADPEPNSLLDPSTLLFSSIRDVVNLRDFHPPPMHAFMLWQTFLQNVNPLSKVIHAPLVQPQVIEASKDFDSVPKPSVALLFAIYAAAVMSLKEEDCRSQLNGPKTVLLSRYFSACQQALAAASFMKSRSIVTLQAFVVFLLPARQIYDAQTFWLLAGIAVRLGLRMAGQGGHGLSNDSVYNSQLRRRLWRQIVWIDGRSHSQIGVRPSLQEIRISPLPANLNDADINPDMAEMPMVHKGPTEMTFCLCRYEVGEFMTLHARKLHDPDVPVRTKDQLIDQFESHMEDTYLKYLDSAIPLHLMAEGGVRSAVCKLRLMAHHPAQYKGKSMPRAERDMLFAISVQMVEYDVLGKSTKALDTFSWHLDVAFQIDAFVFMLIASRTQAADSPMTERAWRLVSDMYKYRPALLEDGRNELYAAVRALTLRAWEAREADIARKDLDPLAVPNIISELRERKSRKARTASMASILVPPDASALHQLAGVATQVDTRYNDMNQNLASSLGGGINTGTDAMGGPFIPDLDLQFDSMFSNLTADVDVTGWAPVDWDYWNALLERNNVLQ
ncbi:hypothetical protein M406DRAFT_328578 [Cryphonectria parasitica EP155]|uniref:Xylanolytic transcriptional activator regulatory domain-containing protein n=1 Tax=Cryphonectria parasitica (strain ATCC 38755 / EP155) TaxID=660469 RepID=A0A9P4Y6S9_CRYP1|nr:uncharacterized protein M406DRAFT_328578 [Cryphonectria parasitica EP155]KAF3767504.1 hypothetical protein M406DRAFT_328578 [Cryphonectria parasitica EP155]